MRKLNRLATTMALAVGVGLPAGVWADEAYELTFQNHLIYDLVEQHVYVERKAGSEVVHRVTPIELQRYIDKPIYAAAESVINAPFDHGEVGPYAKGQELGMTLGAWLAGTGTATYTCEDDIGTLDSTFEGLVPDGLYTMWYFIAARPPTVPFASVDMPLGERDGSQSVFNADADGRAAYKVVFSPCLQLSGRQLDAGLAIAYHSDGKVYGGYPGPLSTVSHVQAFAVFPVEDR